MATTTQLAKWGHSLAVRIPKPLAESARLREGDSLQLELNRSGEIVLRQARPRYSLEDLLSQITTRNQHAETDWGPRVGKEAW